MSKKFHPYIAQCLLFLFSFLLAESGLHALIHADHHGHAHIGEASDHHAGCNHSDANLSIDTTEEVCNLCSEFTLSTAYAVSAFEDPTSVFTGSFLTALSSSFSENSEIKLHPTRGPPVA